MSLLSPATQIVKRVGWSRLYDFDFSNFGEFAEDVPARTISSATIAWTPSGLTLGSAVIGTDAVQQRVAGGTAGTLYTGSCTVTTSGDDTLSLTGRLAVIA